MAIVGRNIVAMMTGGALVNTLYGNLEALLMLDSAIRVKFANEIATPESLPTQYDNDPTDISKNGIWCRFTINTSGTAQKSIGTPGANVFRTNGIATAQLFGPLGVGDADLVDLAEKIETAFRNTYSEGVHFGCPLIKKIGRTDNWWQINVHCPFYFDVLA